MAMPMVNSTKYSPTVRPIMPSAFRTLYEHNDTRHATTSAAKIASVLFSFESKAGSF